MSNDKAAATYGRTAAPHEFHWNSDVPGSGTCTCGRPLADPLHRIGRFEPGDQVLVTELPAYDHHMGTIDAFSRGAVRPYFVRFDNGERYGWFDAAQLEALTMPTGEHIWDKVTEDTMAAYSEADAKATMRMYEALPGKPKRDWTPTKGELALAMGIVLFIIAIFVFIVIAY